MKKVFSALAFSLCLVACTSSGQDEKILMFECQEQFQGQACWKLGKKREGEEALRFFRMGCEKGSNESCESAAPLTSTPGEAQRLLELACGRKSVTACEKLKK